MARRKGDTWFVGVLGNNDAREVEVDFSFLPAKTVWNATVYSDGGDKVDTAAHVKIDTRKVRPSDRLRFALQPRGGVAIRLEPLAGK